MTAANQEITLKLTITEIRLCRDALFHALRTDGGDYNWSDTEKEIANSADGKLYEAIPKWNRPYHERFVPAPDQRS